MNPVVVKVGGAQVSPERISMLTPLLAARWRAGVPLVVVHGGGARIAAVQSALGHPPSKVKGLRVTPEAAMPAVVMALRGEVNTLVVGALVRHGLPALGLSGIDLALLRSDFLNARELGRVGGPPVVDADRLSSLCAAGMLPVLASICLGPDGRPLNVNADTVAHSVAVALGAEVLEFVSDVPGVLTEGVVEASLGPPDVERLLRGRHVRGGMVPKLQAALAAVEAGVARVRIGSFETLSAGTATEVHA